jgi:putative transposase
VFWLAAVRDVFSNRIVGWKTSDRCDTELVLGALEYGVWSRDVRDGQLRHHSDRGSPCEPVSL